METIQVYIKTEEDERKEDGGVTQHKESLEEGTPFLEPLKSKR
jgi:hypothetical protein